MSTWRKELGKHEFSRLVSTSFPELWLPDLNSFHLPAVLPGWLFVLRTQHARGTGEWARTFGEQGKGKKKGNPEGSPLSVAHRLLRGWGIESPSPEQEEALADWLAQVLFVVKRERGRPRRERKILGLLPLHSHLLRADIPLYWSHTRRVPLWMALELSDTLKLDSSSRPLGHRDRLLLQGLGPGLVLERGKGLASDGIRAEEVRDLDQRLAVEVALALKTVPATRVASFARPARLTREGSRAAWGQLRDFVEGFATVLPSRSFTQQFLALTSAVLTREFLAHVETVLQAWSRRSPAEPRVEQRPSFLADLSDGRDRELVAASRRSFREQAERLRQYMLAFTALHMAWQALPPRRLGNKPDEAIPRLLDLAVSLRAQGGPEGLDEEGRELRIELRAGLGTLARPLIKAASKLLPDEQAECVEESLSGKPSLDALTQFVLAEVAGPSHAQRARAFLRSCAAYNYPFGLLRGASRERSRANQPYWRLPDPLLEAFANLRSWRRVEGRGWERRPLSVSELVDELEELLGIAVRVPDDPQLGRRNVELLRDRLAGLGLFHSVSDAERMQRVTPLYEPSELQEPSS